MPRLTDLSIRAARPGPADRLMADGRNLFLRVRPSGSKTFVVRIRRAGTRRVHTIGNWPAITLAAARKEAAHIVATERGDARVRVAAAVDTFMDLKVRPSYKRTANAEVYARVLTERLGALSIDTIRPFDISRMVADYRRTAPVSAMRLLSFTKRFFGWAAGFGYIDRSPAAELSADAFGVEEQARDRVLTDAEIRAFWHADDLPHVRLLRFLLLTGVRIGEAQVATVDWIGGDHWLRLPPEVMKNAKPHKVFVSPLARAQVERGAAPNLFRGVSPTAVQAAVRRWQDRHEVENRWTPHDLRRTFATRCGDLHVPPHIISRLLGHTLPGESRDEPRPSDTLSVYMRSEWLDERKAATLALAAHIAEVIA